MERLRRFILFVALSYLLTGVAFCLIILGSWYISGELDIGRYLDWRTVRALSIFSPLAFLFIGVFGEEISYDEAKVFPRQMRFWD